MPTRPRQPDEAPWGSGQVDVSVVVPVHNSHRTVAELVERLRSTLTEAVDTHEVILVNDGSADDSWQEIERLAGEHREVVGIDLLRNHGQDIATMCGMDHARGHFVATLDDDLQQPPEELATLLAHLRQHPELDAVVGTWPHDQGLIRNLGTRLNALLDRASNGTPRGFHHTAFRVMRRPTVEAMLASRTRTPIVWALLTQSTARVENVQVRHEPRQHGASGYTLAAATRLVLKNFLQGTTLPLRMLSVLGFVSASVAFLLIVLLLVRWAAGVATPPGWASSTLAIVFFGGMTLFGIGLIGEYLRLLIIEARSARWTVRRVVGHGDVPSSADARS